MFQGTRKGVHGVPMVFVVFNLGILGDEITHKYIQRTPLNHGPQVDKLIGFRPWEDWGNHLKEYFPEDERGITTRLNMYVIPMFPYVPY